MTKQKTRCTRCGKPHKVDLLEDSHNPAKTVCQSCRRAVAGKRK